MVAEMVKRMIGIRGGRLGSLRKIGNYLFAIAITRDSC